MGAHEDMDSADPLDSLGLQRYLPFPLKNSTVLEDVTEASPDKATGGPHQDLLQPPFLDARPISRAKSQDKLARDMLSLKREKRDYVYT